MMSVSQCLAKANQMEALALGSATEESRKAYADLALGWRRSAALARQQDALEAAKSKR